MKVITEWMQKHWKLCLILTIVLFLVWAVCGTIATRKQNANKPPEDDETNPTVVSDVGGSSVSDSTLMRKQPDLIKKYGESKPGFVWDLDGTLLSLGDKSMSAEDVVYTYLNGIRSLNFETAQKYSRKSRVVSTCSSYYDSSSSNTDYDDAFYRNIYKQALLSIKVLGIEDNSIFAENKQVFTVRVQMLDLTDKTFWEKDKAEIYKALQIYSREDSTRADIYLYDYILEYYRGEGAVTREVTFDLTLEKYADLDTGWLVSIDTDVDNACRYTDGVPVIRYIKEMYSDEGYDFLNGGNTAPTSEPSVSESSEQSEG